MIRIIQLLNEFLVLTNHKCEESQNVLDDLRDEVQQNIDDAKKLVNFANDFENSFKELRELGTMSIVSPTNIRLYIGELVEESENYNEEN